MRIIDCPYLRRLNYLTANDDSRGPTAAYLVVTFTDYLRIFCVLGQTELMFCAINDHSPCVEQVAICIVANVLTPERANEGAKRLIHTRGG